MTTTLAAAAVLAPFGAAFVGMLFGRRLPFGPGGVAVLGTLASAVLAVLVALDVRATPSSVFEASTLLTPTGALPVLLGVRVDALSATVAVMVATIALAIQVYSIGYLRGDPRYSSYAALISLFTAAMLTVVLASDLLVIYAGWEVMGICSYFLIGHYWEDRAFSAAAVKSFLMTRFGDVGFLFGIFVLGVSAGSFRVSDVLAAAPSMPAGTVLTGTLLLTAGVVGKAAQFPLHSWLPDAMAGPSPVSALIHAATMVAAGAYVVARLYPAFEAAPATLDVIAVLAVISMLGAALAALAAEDLKRVLAYSTISQLAVMFAALAVGGRIQAVGHLLSHAAFKALLFLCAGAVIHAVGSNLMADMGGLRHAMPITFATMTVGFAALAGLPPTSGFFTKDAVVAAAEHSHRGAIGVIVTVGLLLTIVVTGAYATRAWLRTFFGPVPTGWGAARASTGPGAASAPTGRAAVPVATGPGAASAPTRRSVVPAPAGSRPHEAPPVMTVPLVALALPALLLGFVLLRLPELRPQAASATLAVALALAGAVAAYLGWRRHPARDPVAALGRSRQLLASAFRTDDLYERTVALGIVRLARGVLGVDDHVVGRAVSGTGRVTRALGGLLRLVQNGNPQFYVTGVLTGVLMIAVGVAVLS